MSVKVYNLERCPYSNKNGLYGGAAGSKDGILIENQRWIALYPAGILFDTETASANEGRRC